jgi:transposase
VIAALEEGVSYRQAAARYDVSASAAVNWARRFRRTGSVAAKPMGGDRRSRLTGEREWLLGRIAAEPELTLAQLHEDLAMRGVRVSRLTLQRFLAKQGIDTRKGRTRR